MEGKLTLLLPSLFVLKKNVKRTLLWARVSLIHSTDFSRSLSLDLDRDLRFTDLRDDPSRVVSHPKFQTTTGEGHRERGRGPAGFPTGGRDEESPKILLPLTGRSTPDEAQETLLDGTSWSVSPLQGVGSRKDSSGYPD